MDVNSKNLPADGPIEPKHVGNKNKLVYIYIYGVFYVGFQTIKWKVMIKNTTYMTSLLTIEI